MYVFMIIYSSIALLLLVVVCLSRVGVEEVSREEAERMGRRRRARWKLT